MKRTRLCSTLILLIAAMHAHAQADLQNNGILYLTGGTDILYINGNFVNATTATLTNNGNLYVKQNLTNNQASLAVGTGTLFLNGTSAQAVNGTQKYNAYNLITNNSAGITLNNDLSVTNVHTYVAGLIATSVTPNYLIYESGSSYTGDGDAAHVNGWVKKNGSTNFTFPVGNATYERVIGISGLTAGSTFTANYAGATTNTGNLASPLVAVEPGEYWVVNKISGGSAQMVMNWDNSKVAFPVFALADLRTAYYTAGNWTNTGGSASGNVTTTGTITSNLVSSFGSFTIGSITAAIPVQLVSFSAHRSEGNVVVDWITADESNMDHYDVQRSADGISFVSIGSTPARNLPLQQQYEFTDSKPLSLIAYYRLQCFDKDNRVKYSKVVVINPQANPDNSFTVINPARNFITVIAGFAHTGEYTYRLHTINGQLLQKGIVNMVNGGVLHIPVQSILPRGTYIFDIHSKTFNYQRQIVIQ